VPSRSETWNTQCNSCPKNERKNRRRRVERSNVYSVCFQLKENQRTKIKQTFSKTLEDRPKPKPKPKPKPMATLRLAGWVGSMHLCGGQNLPITLEKPGLHNATSPKKEAK